MDYIKIQIDETSCVETLYKDEQEVSKNVHSLRQLSSYLEDNVRLVLVFNRVEYICLRKSEIEGDITKLKALLEKTMSKVANGKK